MNRIHVATPRAQARTFEMVVAILGHWNGSLVDIFAFQTVDKVDLQF
jgi:hypothetical protein